MALFPSWYSGNKTTSPTLFEYAKSLLGFLLFIGISTAIIFFVSNWEKNSRLLGFSPYKNVDLLELLSFSNFYDGKRICTNGFYVKSGTYSILKVSLNEDEFTRSVWINDPMQKIVINLENNKGAIVANFCGQFQYIRGGEFGIPPVWNQQLTVESFKAQGNPLPIPEKISQ